MENRWVARVRIRTLPREHLTHRGLPRGGFRQSASKYASSFPSLVPRMPGVGAALSLDRIRERRMPPSVRITSSKPSFPAKPAVAGGHLPFIARQTIRAPSSGSTFVRRTLRLIIGFTFGATSFLVCSERFMGSITGIPHTTPTAWASSSLRGPLNRRSTLQKKTRSTCTCPHTKTLLTWIRPGLICGVR